MTVKARIASIRLIEKIHQFQIPDYAERIGLSIQPNEATSSGIQQKNIKDERRQ